MLNISPPKLCSVVREAKYMDKQIKTKVIIIMCF